MYILIVKQFTSNTSKSNYESKQGKKIKVLKYSNIEYFKDSQLTKNKNLNTFKEGRNKKSQVSAGFSIWDKEGNVEKLQTPGSRDYNANKMNGFVDDEINLSYHDNFVSPHLKENRVLSMLKRGSGKQAAIREGESIVPPLILKDLGNNKNNQNGTTGKLTRTTMQSTQIRDKVPLNNLKNISTGKSNKKSNLDCKSEL